MGNDTIQRDIIKYDLSYSTILQYDILFRVYYLCHIMYDTM